MKSRFSMCITAITVFAALGLIGVRSAQAQTYSVLYTFTGGADGGNPVGGLIRDEKGNLYGTTCCGGTYGAGTVFVLDKAGKETVLYRAGGPDLSK